jgi:hypothetical protein
MLMVALVLCAAVVVDLGIARDARRQSQNAADAASLAAANVLYPTTNTCSPGAPPCIANAVTAVKAYSEKNFDVTASDWAGCSVASSARLAYVPSGESTCISFDSLTSPTLVRVHVPRRNVSTFFGAIIGRSSIPVGSLAEAKLGLTVECSLCFLGDVDSGNGDITVTGGSVAVNGNVTAGPNSDWASQSNGVVGTVSGGNFTPAARNIPSFPDPLASSLTFPLSTSGLSSKSDPCSHGPGVYANVNLPNSTCNLQPGMYVITGAWGAQNKTKLQGTGVTLYVKSPSGYLDLKNGDAIISAPAAGTAVKGARDGYVIIYDPDNTKGLGLQGNGDTMISGIVYAPKSRLDFNGNSCFGFRGGPIVVGGGSTNGNKSCITVTDPVDTTVTRLRQYLSR